jgi:hypothetical protein
LPFYPDTALGKVKTQSNYYYGVCASLGGVYENEDNSVNVSSGVVDYRYTWRDGKVSVAKDGDQSLFISAIRCLEKNGKSLMVSRLGEACMYFELLDQKYVSVSTDSTVHSLSRRGAVILEANQLIGTDGPQEQTISFGDDTFLALPNHVEVEAVSCCSTEAIEIEITRVTRRNLKVKLFPDSELSSELVYVFWRARLGKLVDTCFEKKKTGHFSWG